ncbi:MAG: bifunctional response regulator/alkaline phosphatase family protein [Bacteroidota bacterium]|nr:bifunctional response regulator/alkaline phosphatase family protein [Bacteroidota bacterium]
MMSEDKGHILWVDDEVELLRPHILHLEQRGYRLSTVTNGEDALDFVRSEAVDLILLDESMPGMGGLETLSALKDLQPDVPVVMVTKNEEESLMEEAIGEKISDYLTKPVNPSQILLVAKKVLQGKRIVGDRTAQYYIREFNDVTMKLQGPLDLEEWMEIYRKLVEWEIELDQHPRLGLQQTMADQRKECNQEFCKFVERNYRDWLEDDDVTLSPQVVDRFLLPHLDSKGPVFFFVIDCMRYDQWLIMEQHLCNLYTIEKEFYMGILPTATPYARNAIFSGYYPSEIERVFPDLWASKDDDDYSMNKYEKEFLEKLLERRHIKLRNDLKYIKIIDPEFGKQMVGNISSFVKNHLTAIVVNFVDMLAHSRSDYPILKEIAPDESAYRSLTNTWFTHSSLYSMFQRIARTPNATVVVTTDHGSVRCMRGSKVLGDRETSTNLRYKYGRNVKADSKHAMYIRNPEEFKLPRRGVTVNYVIAKEDYYFVYPTEYNKYLSYYRDSFQHGGMSLEELILPVITMKSKA